MGRDPQVEGVPYLSLYQGESDGWAACLGHAWPSPSVPLPVVVGGAVETDG